MVRNKVWQRPQEAGCSPFLSTTQSELFRRVSKAKHAEGKGKPLLEEKIEEAAKKWMGNGGVWTSHNKTKEVLTS